MTNCSEARAGPIFALFSKIGMTEAPIVAKQRTINSDIGAVRDAPGFQVNKKVIKPR